MITAKELVNIKYNVSPDGRIRGYRIHRFHIVELMQAHKNLTLATLIKKLEEDIKEYRKRIEKPTYFDIFTEKEISVLKGKCMAAQYYLKLIKQM